MDLVVITEELTEKIRAAVAHSEKEENWYYPDRGDTPPGDLPGHFVEMGHYGAVFSHTIHAGRRYKYLSIRSLCGEGVPAVPMFLMLAKEFGLLQPQIGLNEEEGTAVAIEEVAALA